MCTEEIIDQLFRALQIEEKSTKSLFKKISKHGYINMEFIGEGTNGVVYMAQDRKTNEKVAIKILKACDCIDVEYAEAEIEFLRACNHINIVRYKHDFRILSHKSPAFYVVTEHMELSLHTYMAYSKEMEPDLLESYVYQILNALEYLHSIGFVHLDLKPSNILLDATGIIKLCDFGSCMKAGEVLALNGTTIPYAPPEMFSLPTRITCACDMWSFGCIYYEMVARKLPFPEGISDGQIEYAHKKVPSPFILNTIQRDPDARWSAAKLKESGLFDGLSKEIKNYFNKPTRTTKN